MEKNNKIQHNVLCECGLVAYVCYCDHPEQHLPDDSAVMCSRCNEEAYGDNQ